MRAGRLRHLVDIERETRPTDTDDSGGYRPGWETVVQTWASIEPLRGTESVLAQQLEEQRSHKITIRYYPGIDASMRIKWQGRIFNIRSVLAIREIQNVIELAADEGVAT